MIFCGHVGAVWLSGRYLNALTTCHYRGLLLLFASLISCPYAFPNVDSFTHLCGSCCDDNSNRIYLSIPVLLLARSRNGDGWKYTLTNMKPESIGSSGKQFIFWSYFEPSCIVIMACLDQDSAISGWICGSKSHHS
jgi:hypothetical protein